MNYAEIKYCDIANGLGVRTSLFVSGCRNACENCFNREAWDFHYGNPFDRAVQDQILESLKPGYIAGLSVLGGEPFEPENQKALLDFLDRLRGELPEKTVWCYSGFRLEELQGLEKSRAFTENTAALLEKIDVLVDGRFVEELKNISLKFRGSSNQRVIDLKKTLAAGGKTVYLLLD